VQAIYLCGTEVEHGELARRIEADLALPVRIFDPLAGLQLSAALKSERPANSGRFAPLLGMLADELLQVPHGIDFLHPHRAPPPPSKRNTYVLAAAAAACLVLLVGGTVWMRLAALDRQIRNLAAESKRLDTKMKEVKELRNAVGEIQKWTDTDIVWLEELRQLSQRFPESKDAMLKVLRLHPHTDGGAMDLDVLVREHSTIYDLENALRDDFHNVKADNVNHDASTKTYSWSLKSAVIVKPQERKPAEAPQGATASREVSQRE
jgi:hypothetical protein